MVHIDAATSERLVSRNNFNIIRTVAALAVVLAHSRDLSGSDPLGPLASLSLLAVQAFFVISGYLIVQSYERSKSVYDYFRRRLFRIYPAYFVVIFGSAIGLSLASQLSASDYFGTQTARYVIFNLIFLNFLQPALPGVFDRNPVHAVNGALWTLKIEVVFYAFVPIFIYLCRRSNPAIVITALFLLSALYGSLVSDPELQRQFPGQLTYFMVGAALYFGRNTLLRRLPSTLIFGATAFFLSSHIASPMLHPIGVGLLVFAIAHGPYVDHLTRYGDPSYGIYIMHFPIIQLLVAGGWFLDPRIGILLALAIVLPAAFLMWHSVEKRFLGRRRNQRRSRLSSIRKDQEVGKAPD